MGLKLWRRVGEAMVVGDCAIFLQSVGDGRASFILVGPADVPMDRLERLDEEDWANLEPEVRAFLRDVQAGKVEHGEGGR